MNKTEELKKKKKIEELKKAEKSAIKLNSANPVYSQGTLRNPEVLKRAKKKGIALADLSGYSKD